MEFDAQQQEVREWLKRRRAIMLAHNYQPAPIQDVADFVGDSLELSMTAAKTDAEVIVFCGVHFMAESADVLSAGYQKVILPDMAAGCSLERLSEIQAVRQSARPGHVSPSSSLRSPCIWTAPHKPLAAW